MTMTKEEVGTWALERGFVQRQAPEGCAMYLAPYKDGFVCLELLARNVRMTMLERTPSGTPVVRRHATTHPKNLFVNEDGMLEGIGLSTSLVMSFRTDADIPAWYPPAYAAKARDTIAMRADLATAVETPTPSP